ncbi:hypothetical protein ACFZCL_09315 [Streptomyces sp. NPDC008159]
MARQGLTDLFPAGQVPYPYRAIGMTLPPPDTATGRPFTTAVATDQMPCS